eukprot:8752089-Pyramimonas_sp.AAC.1
MIECAHTAGRGPIGGGTRGYTRGVDQSEEGQEDIPEAGADIETSDAVPSDGTPVPTRSPPLAFLAPSIILSDWGRVGVAAIETGNSVDVKGNHVDALAVVGRVGVDGNGDAVPRAADAARSEGSQRLHGRVHGGVQVNLPAPSIEVGLANLGHSGPCCIQGSLQGKPRVSGELIGRLYLPMNQKSAR